MEILVPLVILVLYLVSFSSFLSWFLPEDGANVTADFVGHAWKPILVAAVGLYLVFLLLFMGSKGTRLTFGRSTQRPPWGDLFLVLLPLAPVAQYIVNNQDILSPYGSLYVLAVFAVFSVVFIFVIPALLGIVCSTETMTILGLAFTFTITNMAFLSAQFRWFERGNLFIQMGVFGGVFLVGLLIRRFIGRRFLYVVVTGFFLANSVNQALTHEPEVTVPIRTEYDSPLVGLVGSRQPLTTPNIYLLIYDAYVGNETLRHYGIDNSAQELYLQGQGFQIYPGTYSVAAATVSSMSRTLNVSLSNLDNPRKAVSGDGVVPNLLKNFGYSTGGIFFGDYFFQGVESSYDFSFPGLKATHKLLVKAILMGEFRFDVEIDNPPHGKFLKYKSKVFDKIPETPRFIYMHDEMPGHSQNSGNCRPDETALFAERLAQANIEMKQDLELINRRNPDAIIVVAGDHGPYLTKNCNETGDHYDVSEISRDDIQDRLGTFLAIKWPAGSGSVYDDISILQDVFPAIFATLFQDKELLESRINPVSISRNALSGAYVENGIIHGGVNDGEPLFLNPK